MGRLASHKEFDSLAQNVPLSMPREAFSGLAGSTPKTPALFRMSVQIHQALRQRLCVGRLEIAQAILREIMANGAQPRRDNWNPEAYVFKQLHRQHQLSCCCRLVRYETNRRTPQRIG